MNQHSNDLENESTGELPAVLSRKEFRDKNPHLSEAPSPPKLLSRRQVAQRWGCCEHTVARRKDLKPMRFNRRMIRYRIEDVEAVERDATA